MHSLLYFIFLPNAYKNSLFDNEDSMLTKLFLYSVSEPRYLSRHEFRIVGMMYFLGTTTVCVHVA